MQTVPAGSNTYKALQYSLNQETHLRVFLDNSDVPMDNNTAERAIRPFTVGLRTGAMWIPSVVPRPVPSCTVWWRPPKPTVSGFIDYLEYVLTELAAHQDDTDRAFLADLLPWSKVVQKKCRIVKKK